MKHKLFIIFGFLLISLYSVQLTFAQDVPARQPQGVPPGTSGIPVPDGTKTNPDGTKSNPDGTKPADQKGNQTNQEDNKATPKEGENSNGTDGNKEQAEELTDNETYEDEMEMRKAREREHFYVDGLPIFGHEYFINGGLRQGGRPNLAPPANYIIGPGDEIYVDVTGNSLKDWKSIVQPDGSITLDGSGLGKIYIGGKTLNNAYLAIKSRLNKHRFSIDNGSHLDVSITNTRTINISVIGEVVKPGPYQVSSYATVMDALYAAQGISKNGSYRNVELIRDGQIYQSDIDIYDFLLRGDLSNNLQLQEGDILRIPVYKRRVGITGEVKRAGLYEVQEGESLKDVISFAGGYTDYAYTFSLQAIQFLDKEKRVRTIMNKDFPYFTPVNGDRYEIGKILDRYENRVSINGAVFRPGEYELEVAGTLSRLILLADGLKEDAYQNRGYLIRINAENYAVEQIAFDVKEIMNGNAPDIVLQREDAVHILSIFDMADQSTVTIHGRVRKPGSMNYYTGMTVQDLILLANGFADGADYKRVQIARRVKDSDRKAKNARMAEIIEISVDPYLQLSDKAFKLEPYDIVSVLPNTGYVSPITASIEGEVMLPGTFTLDRKDNRVSDLIRRAGGFTDLAYIDGASLYRIDRFYTQNEADINAHHNQQRKFKDKQDNFMRDPSINPQSLMTEEQLDPDFVVIDLKYIMKHPGSEKDLILKEGDRLAIPRNSQIVTIKGQVNNPTMVAFEKGRGLMSYITDFGGGFADRAFKRKTYVRYANGKSKSKRFFGGFPAIEPGAEIYVPAKVPKERNFNLGTVVGFTSSVASTAAVIIALIRLSNNK